MLKGCANLGLGVCALYQNVALPLIKRGIDTNGRRQYLFSWHLKDFVL